MLILANGNVNRRIPQVLASEDLQECYGNADPMPTSLQPNQELTLNVEAGDFTEPKRFDYVPMPGQPCVKI